MRDKDSIKEKIMDLIEHETELFSEGAKLNIDEIGDGNINYIYRVSDIQGKSVIVKFADEFIRGSETRKLSTERSDIEYFVLKKQHEKTGGKVPDVFLFDEDNHCIVMEDLKNYKMMRLALGNYSVYPKFAEQISDYLYDSLVKSTDIVMDPFEKKGISRKLINPVMCEISERLVFTEPYKNRQGLNSYHPENEGFVLNRIYGNTPLQIEVSMLKDKFKNYSQSMIHGDLHTGSIFINHEDMKVFDPEFAFYGPMGYDIGNVIGNLLMNFIITTTTRPEESTYLHWMRNTIISIIRKFIDRFDSSFNDDISDPMMKNLEGFSAKYLESVISDSIGYAGTEMIRRTIGVAKIKELVEVEKSDLKRICEIDLLTIGTNLVMERNVIQNGSILFEVVDRVLGETNEKN